MRVKVDICFSSKMSPETREDVDFSNIENSLKQRKRIFILREKNGRLHRVKEDKNVNQVQIY